MEDQGIYIYIYMGPCNFLCLLAWEELQVKVGKFDFGGNIPKNIQQKRTHAHTQHTPERFAVRECYFF